jgi:hypothetical protein
MAEGQGRIYVRAININDGSRFNCTPPTVPGKFISSEPSDNPCGVKVYYEDANGNIQSITVEIK